MISETFWKNPKYFITLEKPSNEEDKCIMIVGLQQTDRRGLITQELHKNDEEGYERPENRSIGFYLFRVRPQVNSQEPTGMDELILPTVVGS